MDNELGEFVGKGFKILRDRLKVVEAREALNGIDGQDGKDGAAGAAGGIGPAGSVGPAGNTGPAGERGPAGKDGKNVKGDQGNDGESIRGEKGDQGDQGETGKAGQVGPKGKDGTNGTDGRDATAKDGEDGNGIQDVEINKRGHLVITLDDGRKIDAGRVKGKDAVQFQGMIASGPSSGGGGGGGTSVSGIATLDFGASNKTASFVVTGISSITATSVVLVKMRIEDTADHIAEDLLIDPIRVEAFAIVAGTGFTIYGTMGNAPANGKYNVQWALV
jgi:hypothetical protein